MTRAFGALVLFLLIAIAPNASANENLTVEFGTPAQTNGNVTLSGLHWALLVFSKTSAASLNFEVPDGKLTNYTRAYRGVEAAGQVNRGDSTGMPPSTTEFTEPLRGQLGFHDSWSSLYIEAEALEFRVDGAGGRLERADGRTARSTFLPERSLPPETLRRGINAPPGIAWGLAPQEPDAQALFAVVATGIRRIEWHNATVGCHGGECPDGARDAGAIASIPSGELEVRVAAYLELATTGGTLSGQGDVFTVATGGAAPVDATLDGWARLPAASLRGSCEPKRCPDPAGQTLQAQGRLTLTGLQPAREGDRLTSGFSGELQSVRFDESPVDSLLNPRALVGVAVGALGIAAISKLLWGLFARNSRPLLEHPKAGRLHALVHEHPGISFNSLRKATGWGHGTIQYHLKRLLNEGLLVAYTYRNSVRYFENHGRHSHDWQVHAAMQKPELRQLHEWLAGHPGVNQATVLRATSEWGWRRSTTQHYLKLLKSAALLAIERTTDVVAYTALRPAQGNTSAGSMRAEG